MAEVDSSLIEMAITNLLDNGAKYSEGAANIDVRLRKEGSWTIIDVQDQGIGIPEADLKHVFQRFYRVNKAHSTKLGGSGLGLSIVETIINKHLGKIEVKSSLGQGSTFSIFLPSNLGERLRNLEEASQP
jgi:two-component system phosphate regulon sensor histidine kinase PhoR